MSLTSKDEYAVTKGSEGRQCARPEIPCNFECLFLRPSNYALGMLREECPTNADEANELIGAFLLDIGVATDETEALVRNLSCPLTTRL